MHPDIFTPGTYLSIVFLCLKCPNCGRKMTFVWYEFSKGPPTENEVFGCKLADWNHPMLSLSYN
jgi:hypothetical protein